MAHPLLHYPGMEDMLMATIKRHFVSPKTPPPSVAFSPAEQLAIKQVRTLFEVFDKALKAALLPLTAHRPQTTPTHRAHDRGATLALPTPSAVPTSSRVIYRAVDRRTQHPTNVSARDAEVYALIAKTADGTTRAVLLTKLHATARTGIVDGALRRLRLAKLIQVVGA